MKSVLINGDYIVEPFILGFYKMYNKYDNSYCIILNKKFEPVGKIYSNV